MQKNECAECKNFSNMIGEYFCDNLTEQEKSDFLMHIENCPKCRAKYEELCIIIDAAGDFEEVEVPETLKVSVSEALAQEEKAIRKRIDLRKYTVRTVVGVAACTVLAIGVYSGGLYDKFINSDDILSTGENIRTEETIMGENTENSETQNNIIENTEETTPMAGENKDAQKTAAKSKKETKKETNKEIIKTENTSKTVEAEVNTDEGLNTEKSKTEHKAVTEERTDTNSDTSTKEEAVDVQKVRGTRSVTDEKSTASGGGSAEASDTEAAVSAYSLDSEPIEETSEESAETVNTEAAAKSICTVYADNPEAFVKGYGISDSGDRISFEISADQWKGFVNYCRNAGVSVTAEFSQPNGGSINIIVVKNK